MHSALVVVFKKEENYIVFGFKRIHNFPISNVHIQNLQTSIDGDEM